MSEIPQGSRPPDDRAATMVLGPASAEVVRRRRATVAVTVGLGLTALLGGYFVGHAGGKDLDAARQAGTAQGKHESTAASRRDGYSNGYKAGKKAGYDETYDKAYKTAYKQAGGQ
jgi:hypothetical protein